MQTYPLKMDKHSGRCSRGGAINLDELFGDGF
jgi:hypothetical protein